MVAGLAGDELVAAGALRRAPPRDTAPAASTVSTSTSGRSARSGSAPGQPSTLTTVAMASAVIASLVRTVVDGRSSTGRPVRGSRTWPYQTAPIRNPRCTDPLVAIAPSASSTTTAGGPPRSAGFSTPTLSSWSPACRRSPPALTSTSTTPGNEVAVATARSTMAPLAIAFRSTPEQSPVRSTRSSRTVNGRAARLATTAASSVSPGSRPAASPASQSARTRPDDGWNTPPDTFHQCSAAARHSRSSTETASVAPDRHLHSSLPVSKTLKTPCSRTISSTAASSASAASRSASSSEPATASTRISTFVPSSGW